MELTDIWSAVISVAVLGVGAVVRYAFGEIGRLRTSLATFREMVAREYVTKHENTADHQVVLSRIDRMEDKIDQLLVRLGNTGVGGDT